ncbi:hypothetical protein B6U99_05540 [Candidatus Geothermarchaeota archaeon ex4572_27]|nr:MAG: hypothetical protein B6U99_05540 [Candidatus Geothermarchaeota archaeon ex4572_27]
MLRVLIVNNYPDGHGLAAIARIRRSLKALGVKTLLASPRRGWPQGFDAAVLTGTSPRGKVPRSWLEEELKVVERAEVPVLGICFGLHLLAKRLGIPVVRMERRRVGFKEVEVVGDDPLFEGMDRLVVWENHRMRLSRAALSDPRVKVLASSAESPVEALRVGDRPIYGVQFHPERHDEGRGYGFQVLRNFIEIAKSYSG